MTPYARWTSTTDRAPLCAAAELDKATSDGDHDQIIGLTKLGDRLPEGSADGARLTLYTSVNGVHLRNHYVRVIMGLLTFRGKRL